MLLCLEKKDAATPAAGEFVVFRAVGGRHHEAVFHKELAAEDLTLG